MIQVGIDISYNSTGLVIFDPELPESEQHRIKFFQICPEKEKHSASVTFITYERKWSDWGDFTKDELNRIIDAESLAKCIKDLLQKYVGKSPIEIRIEAPINTGFMKGSKRFRNSNDMVIINKMVTYWLMKRPDTIIKLLTPPKIKKAFTGKGNGKKELMIETFFKLRPTFDNTGKVDDVIDAYALATCKFD